MTAALLITLGMTMSSALALEPPPPTNVESTNAQMQPMSILADDGGNWEVGVHHSACDYDWDAYASYVEGWGLYKKLTDWCGWGSYDWNGRYRYGNTWAWEEDFKRYSAGGKEYMYLDTVDLQFYVGHGGPWGNFTFCNTAHDDKWLTTSDCYRSWGNGDNEWVALTSCQVLADSQLANWARCMYGTHLILGFKTNARAHMDYWKTQGYNFAKYICYGYTVPQAWYRAADRSQPAGRVVRTLINELDCLNDRPRTGYVCADSYDWDAWVQTVTAGSEHARYVNVDALQGQMPVYGTAPLSLAEATNQYNHLGSVFGVTVTPTIKAMQEGDNEVWRDIQDGHDLEMDSSAGLYGYLDINNMWTFTQTQPSALMAPMVTAQDARTIADQFLTDNGLMPDDAQFYEVAADTISGGDVVSGSVAAMNASLFADERTTAWQVIYSRVLTYTPPSRLGVDQETIEFSVVGPGAKQKVYVGTGAAGPGMLAVNQVPVLGAMGGWREIDESVTRQGLNTVDILTPAQIYMLHDQLHDLVTLSPPPIQADAREILTHTVAYYEHGIGTSQAELIPVYDLTVEYSQGGEVAATDHAYVPANETYMRPFARIDSAPTEMVNVGETIGLEAADASRTLADLGYDPSLNFTLGFGSADDYVYNWYVNSVEEGNLIGTGRVISYTVTAHSTTRTGLPEQRIILAVTDTLNPDQPTTLNSVGLNVFPRVLLPFVMRAD
jgi:hypothetical protein